MLARDCSEFEAHVLAGAVALVALVDLVQRGDQPGTLDIGFVDGGFGVAQAALHGVEARFGFGQLARHAGDFGARFVELALLRAFFVVGDQQPLARGAEIGFERDHAFFGDHQPLVEAAVFVAQGGAFAGALRQIRFEIGDLRARGGEIDGEVGLGRLQRAQQALRGGEILAQRLTVALRCRQLLLEIADLVAQFAVRGARIVEHRLQADFFGLFGFEIAQRLADRIDQFADRSLDRVELADLVVGVEQHVAQRFVIAAELAAERGEQLLVEFERIFACRGWLDRLFEWRGFAGEEAKSAHGSDP